MKTSALLVDVMAASGLCKSKGEARRMIKQGGARIGKTRVTSIDAVLDAPEVLWEGQEKAVRVLESS